MHCGRAGTNRSSCRRTGDHVLTVVTKCRSSCRARDTADQSCLLLVSRA